MPVGPLFGVGGRQLAGAHLALYRFTVGGEDTDAVSPDLGKVTFFKKNELLGHWQKGEHVRGDEVFTDADTDHQRAAGARDHDPVRVGRIKHGERIGADQAADRVACRVADILPLVKEPCQ